MKNFFFILAFLPLFSCQSLPPPMEDYSIARAAVEAARAAGAQKYSAGYWHQAENAYRAGQIQFKNQDWEEAKESFIRARIAAEKAENSARAVRQKTGEVL